MAWIIRYGDTEMSSDDMLIEDLESVEKATGTPWSIANPYKDIKVARAFLAVAMLRAGKSETQIELALRVMTLRTLKTTFDFKPDDESVVEGGAPLDQKRKRVRTSRGSSRGEPATDGSRMTLDFNESEIASSS